MPFLPGPRLVETDGKLDWVDNSVDAGGQSIGRMHPFWGQFGVVLRAWAYMKTLGPDLKRASELAVLNANYIKFSLNDLYDRPSRSLPWHECVFTDKKQEEFGVSTMDIAKRLIDCGIHPPTIYFPLVVHGAIMIEPTESENLEDLDAFIEAMRSIAELAETDADLLHASPTRTKVGRVDEVGAAASRSDGRYVNEKQPRRGEGIRKERFAAVVRITGDARRFAVGDSFSSLCRFLGPLGLS